MVFKCISPDLLTLFSLIWFNCFCQVKVCRIENKIYRKDGDEEAWTGNQSKTHWIRHEKMPTWDIIEGKLRESCLTKSPFSIFNRPSAPSILTAGQCYPWNKSDQITSQWITPLVSLTLSYWIVGALVGRRLLLLKKWDLIIKWKTKALRGIFVYSRIAD